MGGGRPADMCPILFTRPVRRVGDRGGEKKDCSELGGGRAAKTVAAVDWVGGTGSEGWHGNGLGYSIFGKPCHKYKFRISHTSLPNRTGSLLW